MARENVKGTSYLGLGLKKSEEKKLKFLLQENDMKGKKLLRDLVRKWIKEQ